MTRNEIVHYELSPGGTATKKEFYTISERQTGKNVKNFGDELVLG